MKLVLAIVHDEDSQDLIEVLTEDGFRVTKLATTGGFLKSGNTTLMIGVSKDQVNSVINSVEKICKKRKEMITPPTLVPSTSGIYMPQSVEVEVGGATIFVIDVDQFIKI